MYSACARALARVHALLTQALGVLPPGKRTSRSRSMLPVVIIMIGISISISFGIRNVKMMMRMRMRMIWSERHIDRARDISI